MATVPTHTRVVTGAAARAGAVLPAQNPQVTPRALTPRDLQARFAGTQGLKQSPVSTSTNGSTGACDLVEVAMEKHYRDTLQDSPVNYSPFWKDARVSIRLLNHMSPLILGVIQRPGPSAGLSERKAALTFLTSSTDALAVVMAERLAPNQQVNEYDRLELNSMLAHVIGNLWEKSDEDNAQRDVDELLMTVSVMYSDPEFLKRHEAVAERMQEAGGYLKVDSEETMATRLRLSMHQAALRFYQGTADERLGNGKGATFSFGLKKVDVVRMMMSSFDRVVTDLFASTRFVPSLGNDQRTSIMQGWLRNASEIYRAEYVVQTRRLMDWFREGQSVSPEEFTTRFKKSQLSLQDVLEKTEHVACETMHDLLAVSRIESFCIPSDKGNELDESDAPSPPK